MRLRRTASSLLVAGLGVPALAACGSSAAAPSPSASSAPTGTPAPAVEPHPTGAVAASCRRVMANLPATVDGNPLGRRTEFTAQWGNPATTLRCGVPKPAALTPSSDCMGVNGVGWLTEHRGNVYTFTTIGRAGWLEVRVSPTIMPPSNALVDLTGAARQLPLKQACV